MATRGNLHRVQVLLDAEQERYLSRVSKKTGISISALVRALVKEKMETAKEHKLEHAARELRALYVADEEFTAFTALDAEDWDG